MGRGIRGGETQKCPYRGSYIHPRPVQQPLDQLQSPAGLIGERKVTQNRSRTNGIRFGGSFHGPTERSGTVPLRHSVIMFAWVELQRAFSSSSSRYTADSCQTFPPPYIPPSSYFIYLTVACLIRMPLNSLLERLDSHNLCHHHRPVLPQNIIVQFDDQSVQSHSCGGGGSR